MSLQNPLIRDVWSSIQAYWETRYLRRKMRLCAHTHTRYYGGEGTINAARDLDVEVDRHGNVVSVWFRNQPLPFRQRRVDAHRAFDMRMPVHRAGVELHGVEVKDDRLWL
jgi:hypothetical protein